MSVHAALALACLIGAASSLEAQGCRLALVLALDVSGSVDGAEDRLQREGLAQAILAPQVVRVFLSGAPVALYVFEWSGEGSQVPLLPGWRMIEGEEDLAFVAGTIRASRRSEDFRTNPPTAIGSALLHAAGALRRAPDCAARTIDVSGDGENNEGVEPAEVFAAGALDGVVVNALVIEGALEEVIPSWDDDRLLDWFEAEILQGPGAFSVVADGYADYARAMEAKLLRELELPLIDGSLAGGGAG